MIKGGIFLLVLFFIGCSPYKSFYKETFNADQDISDKKVYRFSLDGNSQSKNIQFRSLNKLESFKLSNVSLEEVDKVLEQLPNPENLKILILDSLNLTRLPASLSRFANINQLSLNHNPQLNFDQTFQKLKETPIEFLNLQNNELTELPKSITLLNNLRDLNLSNNNISGSEPFNLLAQLPKLYSLWLTNNKLDSLPASIGSLSQLKNLYIEHNLLTSVPAEIINMKKLWVLHAGHNFFEELPEEFAVMPSLILLHVNNCKIKNVPEIFDQKGSSVMGLILDNNNLSDKDDLKCRKNKKRYFLLSLE